MKKILFVNSVNYNCGVFQYGRRTYDILRKSSNYNYSYIEVSCREDFNLFVKSEAPSAIVFNYHPATMSWLDNTVLMHLHDVKHFGIYHEGTINLLFDYIILSDCAKEDKHRHFSVPRPLFEDVKTIDYGEPQFPIIGSFGFGFYNKGFERLVEMVSYEFERATIRLNIPFAHYGDNDGAIAKDIDRRCHDLVDGYRINLVVTYDFMKDSVLLNFLGSNTINCFLYDNMPSRGLSSAIDYALSVDVPIAISDSDMFRHLNNPLINVSNSTLKEIIRGGTFPLKEYKEKWSNKNFIEKYEYVFGQTL